MTALAIPSHRPYSSDDEISGARPLPRPHLAVVADHAPATLRPASRWRGPVATEPVETLSLPDGLREDMLPYGAAPSDEHQTRLWIIRIVRDLGREYRATYGVELRTDASAIERMQAHLVTAVARLAGCAETVFARELVRHGLLLGEILVRYVGASWTDLGNPRPWKWDLSFPRVGTVSPVVRVRRFLEQGMREPDLVALFLDLDAASK
jgi:hypothetical protein